MDAIIGNFTEPVNGYLTASTRAAARVPFWPMQDLEKIVGRIEKRLDALGIKAATASKRAGLGVDAIRNMQRGLTKGVNATTLQKLAPVLKTTAAWLLEGEGEEVTDEPNTVPLVGYVGASSIAHFMPAGQLGTVERPDWASATTVAVEIRGESLGPLFERWIVYYDDVRRPVTPDLIGRVCVVGLSDGRVLIKQIKRAKANRFDLLSQTEKPIKNVEIEWAARVKQMVPR